MADVDLLLTDVAQRIGEFAAEVTGRIRAEVPGYLKLPYPEHLQDVETQLSSVIEGLRHRQPPPAAAIDNARDVGRRRATYHLELPDVIEAYHIAYRELWDELLSNADDPAVLVAEVAFIWNWFHRLSAAVAAAYAEETHNRVTTRIVLRRRLVESLSGRQVSQEEQDGLALALGFPRRAATLLICRHTAGQALVPVLDQTRTVGLVTLPGTFIGVLLGGGSPLQAGVTQLVVLLALVGIEGIAVVTTIELVAADVIGS